MQDKYFEYLFSDEYMSPGYNSINENLLKEDTLGYDKDITEFSNIRVDDILPLMYITEDMSYEDAVLLESAYIQYTKHLNEFMGTGNHLYGNQIGVGATDWMGNMNGVSGPLKWLGSLLAGTLLGLFALLGALIRKGKQAIGVALLKRYITKVAAITDEGYKNICGLFTSPRNRACFRTFQEASERDIIVSTDTCAKALGLLDNTLEYNPEDQNPYKQAEDLISDCHDEYLKDIVVSRGFFGFNKLIDKPQEKIDNTNDYAEKYNIRIKNAYTAQQISNHQNEETYNESFNYSGYDSLNEYKSEPEHYGNTEEYAKNMDAYLVAIRAAWENLCKRLIGEVRIGEEVEYLKQNKDLNIPNRNKRNSKELKVELIKEKVPNKFSDWIQQNTPQEDEKDIKGWVKRLLSYLCKRGGDATWVRRIMSGVKSGITISEPWSKVCNQYETWKADGQRASDLKVLWEAVYTLLKHMNIPGINESWNLFDLSKKLNEEGVISWRNEDLDNNLVAQMSDWIQKVRKEEWKITKDFKKKCTELALAVDKEIIAKINRWTTPSGAPGRTGTSGKGYNSPITKAGLEKLWASYKEELDKRIEARVDKFITSNPFDYGVQFLQFTVPSLMKDVLNKVDPNEQQRNITLSYNYETISGRFNLDDIHTEENTLIVEISNWEDFSEDDLNIIVEELSGGSQANESFISYKGIDFKLFEYNEEDPPEEDDDTTALESEDNGNATPPPLPEEKIKVDGYSVAYTIMNKNDVLSILASLNQHIADNCAKPGQNMRAGFPILKQKVGASAMYTYADTIFKNFIPEETGFSLVYKNFETGEVNSPSWDNNKLSLNSNILLKIQQTLKGNDSSANEDNSGVKDILDNLVFVKFPIFYYGNQIIDAASSIKPEWIMEELSEKNKNILLNGSEEEKEDEEKKEAPSIFWPIAPKDLPKPKSLSNIVPKNQDQENNQSSQSTEIIPPLPKEGEEKEKEDRKKKKVNDMKDAAEDVEFEEVNDSLQFNYAAYDSIFEDETPLPNPNDLDGNDKNNSEEHGKNLPTLFQPTQDALKNLLDAHKNTEDDKDEEDKDKDEQEISDGGIYNLNSLLDGDGVLIQQKDLGTLCMEKHAMCDVIINVDADDAKEYISENGKIDITKISSDETSHPIKVIFKNAVRAKVLDETDVYIPFNDLSDCIKTYNDYLSDYMNSLTSGSVGIDLEKNMAVTLNLNAGDESINHILDDNLNKYKDAGISYKQFLEKE